MQDYRGLPKVDELARCSQLAGFPEKVRVHAARRTADWLRLEIRAGRKVERPAEEIAAEFAKAEITSSLRPIVNLSGVILHTGAGRARLSNEVANHVAAVASSHSNVEVNLKDGRRGDRQDHVRDLLKQLTGADDALVVNNAAAGVLLTLSTLCSSKEVMLSRGQMVEIGGSFRMPDIVKQSGCKLVEVGCTNKTRMSDYESALTSETVAVLRCHPSNFKIIGFTEEPTLEALSQFCRSHGLLLIDDQGSGCLVDFRRFGLPAQPVLQDSVANSDVSIASGDKLIGGPQAGLILGGSEVIRRISKHPLARCMRVDKLTLAALEATLRLYVEGREDSIPALKYLGRNLQVIEDLARRLARSYRGAARVEPSFTEIGGGSAPGTEIPTYRVGLPSDDAEDLAARLRAANPPILGRIEGDLVWLDPRTLDEEEVESVENALKSL